MSTPLVLGFDTSAAHVAAALVSGGRVLACKTEHLKRGQAERLMGLLDDVLAEANSQWDALDAVGVGVGPGNFTGIRISVSAARGLALGLGIPAIGVTSFDAISHGLDVPVLPMVPGPRDQAYVAPQGEAAYLATPEQLAVLAQTHHLQAPPEAGLAVQIAQVAATRLSQPQTRPAPFYIKPADAAPPRDPAPVILP